MRQRAAVGASVLFHALLIGTVLHLSTGHPSPTTGHATIEVALMSGSASRANGANRAAPPPSGQTNASKTLASARQPAADTANRAIETPPSGSSESQGNSGSSNASTTSGTVGVSIPAGYAASNRKPTYPLLSRRQEEEGTVLLRVLVKADGTAGTVQIKQSSGYPLLDASALAAVKAWRFRPAMVNHQPTSEWYQLAIPFKLEG